MTSSPKTYEQYQAEVAPYWARRAMGTALWAALGKKKDEAVSIAKQAVKARLPLEAPLDALDSIGSERGLPRYFFGAGAQSDAQYRATLVDAWALWYWGGTAKGLLDELARAFQPYTGFRLITQQGRIWARATNGDITFTDSSPRQFVGATLDAPRILLPTHISDDVGSLVPGTYTYRVSATNAAGETLASEEASVVVPNGSSTNRVQVNWRLRTGATGYRIYGRTAGAELFLYAQGDTNSWVDNGSLTPSGALPGASTALAMSPLDRWNSFQVWFTHALPTGWKMPAPLPAAAAVNVGGSLGAGTYYHRVSATNATGETFASAETEAVVAGADDAVQVTWAAVPGATGYNVYGRTLAGELLIASTAATTYTDDGTLTPAGALPTANDSGTTPDDDSTEASTTRSIISRWKPGHALCDRIVVVADGYPWGYPGALWGGGVGQPLRQWGQQQDVTFWTPP